jgi:hypothetical protein
VSSAERLLPRIALAIMLAAGLWAACAALIALAFGHPEGIDSVAFVLAFAVMLPVAVVVVVRGGPLADASPAALPLLAAVAAIGLVLALAIERIAEELGGGEEGAPGIQLVLIAVWLGGVAVMAIRTTRGAEPIGGTGFAHRPPAWLPLVLLPLLVVVLAADVLPEPGQLALSVLLGAALLTADRVLRPAERIGRAATIAIDAAVVAAIVLLVADVTVFTPEAYAWNLQLHHNSVLGPVNDVLGGREMLVDSYSIYGFGSIYFLAALFEVVPFGYGAFGLLIGAGLALMYGGAYGILRLAGCSQVLAVTAMTAAIVSSVYTTIASPASFPSLGVLRWGFGYLLVGLAVWSVRNERRAPALRIVSAVVVGISSIWSFEVFVYTAATYAALLTYRVVAERPREGWLRSLAKALVPAVVACVVAHLVLAAWTLAQAGQLPDWDPYLAILREFSSGPYNRLVAPPWWVGIAVGGFLFASAVAVAAIVSLVPRFESEFRAALIAIAGMTAFAVATFTYGIRFSSEDYVARASLPAVMVMALWISLAERSGLARPPRTALAATGFWLAALLIVAGWPHLEREAGRTPLIAALPDNGRSIESEVSRAWGNPEISRAWGNSGVQPRSPAAEMLLDRYWADEDQALVLLHPDLSVEALMRSERVNLLPVSYFLADEIIAEERWPRVREAIDEIEPGTLLLTQGFYLTPGATRNYIHPGSGPLSLEQMVIDRIRERFRLRVTSGDVGFDPLRGDDELGVVRLVPRS